MATSDHISFGALKIEKREKPSEPLAAQSCARSPSISANRPDDSVECWSHKQQAKNGMVTFQLSGNGREEWHNEIVETAAWFENGSSTPEPVVRLVDAENHLRGIIHMRTKDSATEVCLSLITPKGKWQTGIWFEISNQDEVNVSWCTDWSGRELTTISLEIQSTTH